MGHLHVSRSNWSLIFGVSFTRSAKLVFDCDYGKNIFIFTYPQLGKLFPNWSGWARLVASKIPRTALFSRIIEEHSTTLQEENPRDFVDVYLKEVRRTNSRESSFYSSRGGKKFIN